MFNWFRKPIEAKEYLRQTKAIRVNGVSFVIKKISIEEHLAGLNVILAIHQTYAVGKKDGIADQVTDFKQVRKFMRDIIFAGVVKPVLNIGKEQNENVHVDEILNDIPLAQELTSQIVAFTYGKKK